MPTISSRLRPALQREARARSANASGSHALLTSVKNVPAMIALHRTVGPKVRANPAVSAFSPALAAA